MKLKHFFLFLLGLTITSSAFSCSLPGEMAASNLRIKGILEFLSADKLYRERSISKIFHNKPDEFIVETTSAGNNCRAIGFQAIIEPTCNVTIKPLKKKFQCGKR